MRRTPRAISGVLLTSALALAGCASATPTRRKPKAIAIKIPAASANTMPAQYTCDGRNTWPTLEWGTVPAGTGSLALFVVGVLPEPATHTYKVSIEWAVAGLNPTMHKLISGKLPPHAYVGTGSSGRPGYSICPPKGAKEQYQFEVYAIPANYGLASTKFSGVALASALSSPNTTPANAYGALILKYTRK